MSSPLLLFMALAAAAAVPPAAATDSAPRQRSQENGTGLLAALRTAAPDADPRVLELALRARACAVRRGAASADARLAVIDYSRRSTQPRLWVFDLEQPSLLYLEHVAHGRNSGGDLPDAFSNLEGSYQSSIGLFTTSEAYHGGNGYSLRMDGLEPGVNDAARSRAIVMHGASYVDPEQGRKQGRLGRSLGCPALRPVVAREVIDTLKGGHLLFAYYPDQAWLRRSRFLACEAGGNAPGAG
ncbi:murein L,D-transpeptidase catalytic domain family protein [Luteimonas sp. RD2P54]|uniref:Murein L,D-transpeptidase catalytic domain family protein n=1 Tax=Luteimonas endophytica TaxID=3042023 RepID=A0ABT6J4M8_9GAMM|nr:murein L,D-transpeptidase catalytic domain family protein [Luteimonas endophytica]MDH5821770.1 murein L,D-transpeptidase catalytic domain family protein [Luteimonas endophytica]